GEQVDASIAKGDYDWYYFTIDNLGVIDIAMIEITNNSSDMEIEFSLYDNQGDQLGSSFTGNPGKGLNIRLSTRDGSYYIKLSEKSGDKEGHYSVKVTDQNANDDNEPDDTFENARIIDSYPSGDIAGTILVNASEANQYGDFEFFVLLINLNKTLYFTLTPTADDIKMNYKIFNEDHSVVVNETEGTAGQILQASVGDGSGGSMTRYLRVGATIGETGNGNYTISFSESDI
ncbi:MAG: hypothetical protein KAT40_06320, partial [Bacteroidales bacterium]|nr:hypothetical protein [Bacteroidales bacterium]